MNILAIGAHFDDIELGCGGALAKHVAQGDKVHAFVATLSGFVNPQGQTVRADDVASKEGHAAMKTLGVALHCGSARTFEVEFQESLNKQIIALVEKHKPERIYTHWTGDIHHDHQAVAKASLHCCRHVPNLLMYRSNWYHSPAEFKGAFYVDITDYWNAKERAVKQHKSEYKRAGYKWVEFFRKEAENAGQRIGVKYAEVFEVVKWLER